MNSGQTLIGKAPNNVIIVCGTILAAAFLGCLTILAVYGKDAESLFRLMNLLMNGITVLISAGAFVYAGSAAKSSDDTAGQLNGEFDKRIRLAVAEVLEDNNGKVH